MSDQQAMAGLEDQAEEECATCLLEVFGELSDTRSLRGRRYPLASVLALVVAGALAGCANASRIFAFGQLRPDLLKRLGFEPAGRVRRPERAGQVYCPNEDSIKAICARVDAGELNEAFARFISRIASSELVAAVDGKALRGSDRHILTIFAADCRAALWQEEVDRDKENEASRLEASLEKALGSLPGLRLLTGDAAFCHKVIARILIQNGRDYLFCLKHPHQTDLAIAGQAFDQQRKRGQKPLVETVEKRGARKGAKL
jgi:hypothetical protein